MTQPTASGSVPIAAAIITAVTVVAYHNSLAGPLVLDDVGAILDNPSIRTLWPPTVALSPPTGGGLTVAGRPLLNLSLAINYAISGPCVRGYHVLNLAIHVAASLTLFGILRRTLLQPRLRLRFGAQSTQLAATAALLWAVHPLQTESVTYVIQRAESLCGLFYLLVLYAFLRGTGEERGRLWLAASVAACLLAVSTKEVAATAPLIVLLYDATFVAGSVGAGLRQRSRYYAALFGSLLLLAWLVAGAALRGGTAGFASGITLRSYALTQVHAVARYLRLALWPHGLVFDYGDDVVANAEAVLPELVLLVALVLAVVLALRLSPPLAFLGLWLLLILAPTSSVVPISTQTIAEHRMYLPLAALAAAVVAFAHLWLGRWTTPGAVLVVIVLATLTLARNETYRTPIALWGDTVAKVPRNSRARNGLGLALHDAGAHPEALDQLAEAIRLKPASAVYASNFALALAGHGMLPEALQLIEEVCRSSPDLATAHDTRAAILAKLGRVAEATAAYRQALRLDPELVDSHRGLAEILVDDGQLREAATHYSAVLRARPGDPDAERRLRLIEREGVSLEKEMATRGIEPRT